MGAEGTEIPDGSLAFVTSRKGGPSGDRRRNPGYQGKQQVLCGNCTKSSYREKFIIYTKSSYREKFII